MLNKELIITKFYMKHVHNLIQNFLKIQLEACNLCININFGNSKIILKNNLDDTFLTTFSRNWMQSLKNTIDLLLIYFIFNEHVIGVAIFKQKESFYYSILYQIDPVTLEI